MRFSIVLAFAAAAIAAPTLEERQSPLCSSGTARCCATDVLELVDLDCPQPNPTPGSINEFVDTCAAVGQQAKCCILPILGQALFCSNVVKTAE